MRKNLGALLLGLVPLGVSAVEFDVTSVRCGTGLVRVGDTTAMMLKACGEPLLVEPIEEPEGGVVYILYHYQIRPQSPATVIEIKRGKIRAIRHTR